MTPEGVEGITERIAGIGLLPAETVFSAAKTTLSGTGFVNISGIKVRGYEIHMGETRLRSGASPFLMKEDGSPDGCISGSVWGTYFHGIFDNDEFRVSWLKKLGWHSEEGSSLFFSRRENELERLADEFEQALDMEFLSKIIGI